MLRELAGEHQNALSRAPASGSRPTFAAMRAATSRGATSRRATSSAPARISGNPLAVPREPALLDPHLEDAVAERRVDVDRLPARDRDPPAQEPRQAPARLGLEDREGERGLALHVVLVVERPVADLDLPLADEALLDRRREALAAERQPARAVAEAGDDDLRPVHVLAAPVGLEADPQVPRAARHETALEDSPLRLLDLGEPDPLRRPAPHAKVRPPPLGGHEVRDRERDRGSDEPEERLHGPILPRLSS